MCEQTDVEKLMVHFSEAQMEGVCKKELKFLYFCPQILIFSTNFDHLVLIINVLW